MMIRRLLAMAALLIASLTVDAGAAGRRLPVQDPPGLPLVGEHGPRVSAPADNTIRMKSGRGWIRTRAIFGDFSLTLEFKLEDERTIAGIGIRTVNVDGEWPKRGYALRLGAVGGLRFGPPPSAPVMKPDGGVQRLEPGAWHRLDLGARGRRLTASIDGADAGAFDIDALAGSILFEVSQGTAEFRDIRIVRLDGGQIAASDYQDRGNFVCPQLVREIRPNYAKGAMGRKVEGTIGLLATVLTDGTVGAVRVVQALDPELEHAALAAVRQWRFTPGTLDGKIVPVSVEIEMTFTLR